jgi:hypothetical protein
VGGCTRPRAARLDLQENRIDFVVIQAVTGYVQSDGVKATMGMNDAVAPTAGNYILELVLAAGLAG